MYTKESKCISYLLRHAATKIPDFEITSEGWVDVDHLLEHCAKQKFPITEEILKQIVAEDEKGRYAFSEGGSKIRANQGHSIDVDLKLPKKIPPVTLYHGTSVKALEGIKKTGIQRMKRQHVHLTDDVNTASSVGMRHGSEVIITINTRDMVKDKIDFFQSENGVWLVNFVDIKYFQNINTQK